MKGQRFTIVSTVKTYPSASYETMKRDILGATYNLSVVFVGQDRARAYNLTYRGKDYIPNVLSFPLGEDTGEIIICPSVAKREAKKFNLTYPGYISYLFIHGLLHLKGHDHGATMSAIESRYVRKYAIA